MLNKYFVNEITLLFLAASLVLFLVNKRKQYAYIFIIWLLHVIFGIVRAPIRIPRSYLYVATILLVVWDIFDRTPMIKRGLKAVSAPNRREVILGVLFLVFPFLMETLFECFYEVRSDGFAYFKFFTTSFPVFGAIILFSKLSRRIFPDNKSHQALFAVPLALVVGGYIAWISFGLNFTDCFQY